jgi:hypothetical protein
MNSTDVPISDTVAEKQGHMDDSDSSSDEESDSDAPPSEQSSFDDD